MTEQTDRAAALAETLNAHQVAALSRAFARMPYAAAPPVAIPTNRYLGHWSPSSAPEGTTIPNVVEILDALSAELRAAADRNREVERERDQLRADVAAVRRLFAPSAPVDGCSDCRDGVCRR